MLKQLRNREDFEQKNLLQKGFTLVELLVVIVILGILAAVVVFAVGGSTDKAKSNSCAAERNTIETAVEAYRASNPGGAAPTAMSDLTTGANAFLRSAGKNFILTGAGLVTPSGAVGANCAGQ